MARRKQEINIFRIAEEAGVSIATVSRVMNHRTGVSETTRARINTLLREYEFKPDYPAVRSPKIVFLTPFDDLVNYLRLAMKGVCRYARTHDMEVGLLARNTNPRATLLQQIRDQQCSGVIVMMTEFFDDEHLELGNSGLPVVFLDSSINVANAGFIDNDSYSGSCAATRHLLELGHRKIGYVRYRHPGLNHIQRFNGYKHTMAEAGITPDPSWIGIPPSKERAVISSISGLNAMRSLLERAPEITAVMAVDDEMALGAMTAIHQSGRKIPDDISVIGFDNYPETEAWYPPLTTIHHPIEEAGYMAATAIGDALKSHGAWTPPREVLPTRLIVRDSTGPAPKTSGISGD